MIICKATLRCWLTGPKADAIIVLDSGRIQEMASHDELMAARGYYYDLYMEQFRPEFVAAFAVPS